ncbi:MAG: hypothetical protein KF745_12970 [Phycisphaeraceae bacterium]|nr:hypothetical protein [Phycisphaeraceae bacterium]
MSMRAGCVRSLREALPAILFAAAAAALIAGCEASARDRHYDAHSRVLVPNEGAGTTLALPIAPPSRAVAGVPSGD